MPLRPDLDRMAGLASGWRRGHQRTGYGLDDYVDLGERADDA